MRNLFALVAVAAFAAMAAMLAAGFSRTEGGVQLIGVAFLICGVSAVAAALLSGRRW